MGVPWGLEKAWIGHADKSVTDRYAEGLLKDEKYRTEWCERVGVGFDLGTMGTKSNVVPMVQLKKMPHNMLELFRKADIGRLAQR
jgi:hypothetical protein